MQNSQTRRTMVPMRHVIATTLAAAALCATAAPALAATPERAGDYVADHWHGAVVYSVCRDGVDQSAACSLWFNTSSRGCIVTLSGTARELHHERWPLCFKRRWQVSTVGSLEALDSAGPPSLVPTRLVRHQGR